MKDTLKDFIHRHSAGFKEKPSEELWKKIDATLTQENIIYKSKNRSTMLKYGFGASLLIIGTFIVMNLQDQNTSIVPIVSGLQDKNTVEAKAEVSESQKAYNEAVPLVPAKKINPVKDPEQISDSVAQERRDTTRSEEIIPKSNPIVLYAAHPPVRDTLDINNWPCSGNQRKKYSLSADHTSGKTIGCIKSVSKNINGFVTMMQSNVPDKYLGKRIRMTGYIRAENVTEWAGMWVRVGVKGGDEALAFDNMRNGKKDRSLKGTTDRTKYEIVLDVPLNSANIIYGVILNGTGSIYFDSFILEIVDETVPTTGGNFDPPNFWRWYVTGRKISKDGTSNINLEPNDF